MAKFKNDKGLTLIELLITIAVLAVVSAIALPVINNVVASSNSNALNQTIKDANDFVNKYSKSGVVAYDGLTKTFQGYVDTDGDNVIDSNELIDTLTLDANKFSATVTGSATVGGSYTSGGVTSTTVVAAGTSSGTAATTFGTASAIIAAAGSTDSGSSWTSESRFLSIGGYPTVWHGYNSTIGGAPGLSFNSLAEIQAAIADTNPDNWQGPYAASVYDLSQASQGHIITNYAGGVGHIYNVDANGNIVSF